MAVLFSKVTISAGNGAADTFLCGGVPKSEYDLENWTAYQRFMQDNPNEELVDVEVKSYVYGDGDLVDANQYEIAYFMQRGENFLQRSTVKFYDESYFTVVTNNENIEEMKM